MFLTLAQVLDADDLAHVRQVVSGLEWRDGARTAAGRAKAVKKNLQADLSAGDGADLRDRLLGRVLSHPVLKAAARPRRVSGGLLSRTGTGGGYGDHVDKALMGDGARRVRTDLSFTLFLTPPDAYEGGELTVSLPGGEVSARPEAGDLILYPSGAIHRVEPVTRGERLAFIGWIESEVRAADQREILFDLENIRAELGRSLDPGAPVHLALDKVAGQLARMWSES